MTTESKTTENASVADADNPTQKQPENSSQSDTEQRPKEIGGRDGLDPTRYGDWEKNGRCIDF